MSSNPILVENIRGSTVENFHRGAAVVIDHKGKILAEWGDSERPVFTRSSIKYLQTIALVESGAVKAFHLSDKEIALACSSHKGEPQHVELVKHWLKTLNLEEGALKCGSARPGHGPSYKELVKSHQDATALHNACSGKHSGFLTTCLHHQFPLETYTQLNHPVQVMVRGIVEELMEVEGEILPNGIDGCGIPVFAYPLRNIALGMSRLSPLSIGLSQHRKQAIDRIRTAITENPFLIAGSNSFDTIVLDITKGKVLIKGGADGIYAGCLPDKGIGFALKIDDGSSKAAEIAAGTLLSHYDVFSHAAIARLKPYIEPTISNFSHFDTGFHRAHQGWLLVKG